MQQMIEVSHETSSTLLALLPSLEAAPDMLKHIALICFSRPLSHLHDQGSF